ncbi:MAG: hypothetical protein CME16_00160, partial [Gemmatimonadetes bacterium]|nr:hypothetical protein [Gemmatimonadota bacterium]
MKILLVDDEKSILQVIGDFLSDCGYDVILAGDGSEALQRLEELEDIGLIISDIRMPKMDGLDLLKAVRVRFPGIPATLMTGHGDEQLAIDALQEGAQGYLKKPLKFDDLLEHIAQVEARDHLEEQVLNEYNNLLRGKEGGALGEPSAQTDDFQGERANLLVLYADRDIWESAGEILEAAGHQVQFAASAEDALKLFANNIFDVVLCEVDSADFSCLDAIGKIRASDPALVAILLTAKPESEMLVRALEVGVSGLLEKPFTGKELKARVARALAERKRLVNVQHLLGDLIQGRGELRQKIVVREHHLSQLIDAAPFGVVSTEGNGSILSFNRQAEKMYGYQEKDILGCDFSVLLEEGDKKTLDGKIASAARSQHRRKDGKPIAVLVRYRIIQDDNNQRAVHLYIIEDLTKREEMESQLIYAEKMSLLGQLAPRIAHEFGTPLQLVSGNLDLASWELEKGNSTVVLEYLDSIRAASEQMNGMVKQMLNIGKPVAYVEKK